MSPQRQQILKSIDTRINETRALLDGVAVKGIVALQDKAWGIVNASGSHVKESHNCQGNAIVGDPPDWIVILCPPRSCSTVVCAMFGCHPEIYAFPELTVLCLPTVEALLAEDARISAESGMRFGSSAGVIRALIDLMDFRQDESGVAASLDWLQRTGTLEDL